MSVIQRKVKMERWQWVRGGRERERDRGRERKGESSKNELKVKNRTLGNSPAEKGKEK